MLSKYICVFSVKILCGVDWKIQQVCSVINKSKCEMVFSSCASKFKLLIIYFSVHPIRDNGDNEDV